MSTVTCTDEFEGGLLAAKEEDRTVLDPRDRLVALIGAALDAHAYSDEEVTQEEMLADLIAGPALDELIDAVRTEARAARSLAAPVS